MATTKATPLLEVRALHAWYGESHVLHGVDFEVGEGEVVTLLGRNGAGRTSTLRAIMGLTASAAARCGCVARKPSACPRTASRGWAWATARKSAAFSPA
jgi:ABC-type branched-subunit amino acid transport system ATPase component